MWRVPAGRCGAIDAAKYKETILPLLFYKRLSDVYVDEIAKENPDLKDVIDISDYNDTTAGQRILPDGQARRTDRCAQPLPAGPARRKTGAAFGGGPRRTRR